MMTSGICPRCGLRELLAYRVDGVDYCSLCGKTLLSGTSSTETANANIRTNPPRDPTVEGLLEIIDALVKVVRKNALEERA